MNLRTTHMIAVLLLVHSAIVAGQQKYKVIPVDKMEVLAELPDILDENSGNYLTRRGTLVGHNDSDGPSKLYEYDLEGQLLRTIKVDNAKNKDWEDITADEEYVYISDTGNNSGKRNKFSIYRVPRIAPGNQDTTVEAERIRFYYSDKDPSVRDKLHNFDCEALISFEDSLYIFTKNRGDSKTNNYAIPKEPGEYAVVRRASFNSDGLVTGADVSGNNLALIGYQRVAKGFQGFIWLFWDYDGNNFFEGRSVRWNLPFLMQCEAIVFVDQHHLVITNEEEEGGIGTLYKVDIRELKE